MLDPRKNQNLHLPCMLYWEKIMEEDNMLVVTLTPTARYILNYLRNGTETLEDTLIRTLERLARMDISTDLYVQKEKYMPTLKERAMAAYEQGVIRQEERRKAKEEQERQQRETFLQDTQEMAIKRLKKAFGDLADEFLVRVQYIENDLVAIIAQIYLDDDHLFTVYPTFRDSTMSAWKDRDAYWWNIMLHARGTYKIEKKFGETGDSSAENLLALMWSMILEAA